MIRVENLSKSYGELQAVDRLSFEVGRGEIYGLLGPNGAGKTTTLSMLSGLLPPDGGRITLNGVDLLADPLGVKEILGVVPQETALYETLTARENLRFWAGLYGMGGSARDRAIAETLGRLGLADRADEPVARFSGGMKRRLNLGMGLVHSPRAVLLDEPTVGIDPQARLNILEVVREIAAGGTTILYTTHYLEEAEDLCDRIGILDHGKLLAEGTLLELEEMIGEEELVTVRGRFAEADVDRLAEFTGARLISREEDRLVLATTVNGGSVAVLQNLFGGGFDIENVSVEPPSLSGLFLKLTGRELRD